VMPIWVQVEPVGAKARTVCDEMVRRPKALPANATIADVRALLADDHVHMALLLRGDRLVGTVTRTDLDATDGPDDPAVTVAKLEGRTVAPGTCLALIRSHMVATGQRRLAVVDHAGRLLGLLCLNRTRNKFCSDRDVASREAAAAQSPSSLGGPGALDPDRGPDRRRDVATPTSLETQRQQQLSRQPFDTRGR